MSDMTSVASSLAATATSPEHPLVHALTFGTALGCGVAAGVFFAFSTLVMSGLQRVAPAQGLAAMQSINVTAIRPLFITLIFGTALACVAVLIAAVRYRADLPWLWMLAG